MKPESKDPFRPDDPAVCAGRKHKASHCQRQFEAAANERVSQVKAGKKTSKSSPERLRMQGARRLGRPCMTKSNASGPLPPPSSLMEENEETRLSLAIRERLETAYPAEVVDAVAMTHDLSEHFRQDTFEDIYQAILRHCRALGPRCR